MLPTPGRAQTLWVGRPQRIAKMNPTASSQISFAQAEYDKKKKRTRREVFLEKMEQVVPWSRLMEVIEPYYPKSGKRGRPPMGLERMLRMYFVQQWYGLADEAVEDAVYDSQALRNFMGIDLSRTNVPDATTLMGFRHLLEAHDLTKAMLVEINVMLMERGLLMTQGTLVDATLIAAPSSTKNKEHARDPEMHQAKKGNQWHFGMKAHIGVDKDSGLVHTLTTTAATGQTLNQANQRSVRANRTPVRPGCPQTPRQPVQPHRATLRASTGLKTAFGGRQNQRTSSHSGSCLLFTVLPVHRDRPSHFDGSAARCRSLAHGGRRRHRDRQLGRPVQDIAGRAGWFGRPRRDARGGVAHASCCLGQCQSARQTTQPCLGSARTHV